MSKDPAMLWYWNDWHSGTSLLSRFLKGCYIDLLHAQFNNGRLSLEEIKICLGADFANSWLTLQKKFKQDGNGLFFNERLEREKEKREAFSKKQKENGLLGGRPNKPKNNPNLNPNLNPKESLLENENENENEIKNSFLEKSEKAFLKNPELWTEAKQDFFNGEGWQYRFCTEKKIERQELIRQMREFVTDLELKEEYKDLQELKSHFTNLFNKQKKSNGSTRTNTANKGKSTGALELLEKVRADFGNNG